MKECRLFTEILSITGQNGNQNNHSTLILICKHVLIHIRTYVLYKLFIIYITYKGSDWFLSEHVAGQ